MFKLLFKLVFFVFLLGVLAAVLTPKYFQTQPVATLEKVRETPPTTPAFVDNGPETKKQLREEAATRMENKFLDQGMDVHVTVSGKNKDIITLKYVLISRPLVHQLNKDGTLIDNLQRMEFKKAIFTDGYRATWTFDLTK